MHVINGYSDCCLSANRITRWQAITSRAFTALPSKFKSIKTLDLSRFEALSSELFGWLPIDSMTNDQYLDNWSFADIEAIGSSTRSHHSDRQTANSDRSNRLRSSADRQWTKLLTKEVHSSQHMGPIFLCSAGQQCFRNRDADPTIIYIELYGHNFEPYMTHVT